MTPLSAATASSASPPPLSAARVAALLPPDSPLEIRAVPVTGSTNADLMAALPALTGPVLLAADVQTAGRGRSGRAWLSAPGRALTFSLAWPFAQPVHALVGLPLAVGVAIAEALADAGAAVTLKWPNDVLHEGRKLGGILIETAARGRDACWAVVGIGLNLALEADTLADIGQAAGNLPATVRADREALLAALALRLAAAMADYERHGLQSFVDRWNALHAHAGRPVAILDHGEVVHEGIAHGIDWIGRLLIDTPAGRVAVMAGDVSLRPRGEA